MQSSFSYSEGVEEFQVAEGVVHAPSQVAEMEHLLTPLRYQSKGNEKISRCQ